MTASTSRVTEELTPAWVGGPMSELAEGPRWHAGQLTWVDITAGALHTHDPSKGTFATQYVPDTLGMVAPRENGGWLLAIGAQIVLRDPDGHDRVLATLGDADMRCNDGVCGPDGALYVGTVHRTNPEHQGIFVRVEGDGTVEPILEGLGISNGIGFSPDGSLAYYVDSLDRRVDVLDLRDGTRDPLIAINEEGCLPDGLAVDAEGAIWVAIYAGGQVRRHLPDGRLDRVVHLPTSQVTAVTFGGADLSDLYITTAREHLGPQERVAQPLAGGVFRIAGAGRGLPVQAFAG
ncbi:MAG: sugar lactone lactonase YvrE [Glaciecola sp.]|jgi:sugar lactone lactonase YvrE